MKASKLHPIFEAWIDESGIQFLARQLSVHPSTISKWKKGHCPRPEQMVRIQRLSKGRVTYDLMVEGSRR